jgi:Cdc6-like AAA superfamily ATPase
MSDGNNKSDGNIKMGVFEYLLDMRVVNGKLNKNGYFLIYGQPGGGKTLITASEAARYIAEAGRGKIVHIYSEANYNKELETLIKNIYQHRGIEVAFDGNEKSGEDNKPKAILIDARNLLAEMKSQQDITKVADKISRYAVANYDAPTIIIIDSINAFSEKTLYEANVSIFSQQYSLFRSRVEGLIAYKLYDAVIRGAVIFIISQAFSTLNKLYRKIADVAPSAGVKFEHYISEEVWVFSADRLDDFENEPLSRSEIKDPLDKVKKDVNKMRDKIAVTTFSRTNIGLVGRIVVISFEDSAPIPKPYIKAHYGWHIFKPS